MLCSELHRSIQDLCEGEFSDGLFVLNGMANIKMPSAEFARQDAADLQMQALVPAVVVDHLRLGERKWLADLHR
jgi:hypothetical protein